jgi:hypothetical protein
MTPAEQTEEGSRSAGLVVAMARERVDRIG